MSTTDSSQDPQENAPDAATHVRPDAKIVPPNEPSDTTKAGQTAAEQMEDYEQDLKENDWGHQPC